MKNNKFIFQIILCLIILYLSGCFSRENRNGKDNESIKTQPEYILNDSLSRNNYLSVDGYMPKDGLIPTAEIAVQIADLVLKNIYGSKNIEKQKPFSVNLKNNIWIIEGQLGNGYSGGVAHIEIRKNNGEIIKVIHGK